MKEKSDTVFYLNSLLMHEGGKNLQMSAWGHVGQRTSVTTSGEVYAAAPADRVWLYDALGQVVSANEDRYAYDRIGNRTSTQKGTEQALSYEANAPNQHASIGSTAPTYDAFGNVIKKTGNKEFAYQFSTKPKDSFTELNYYNYRNYDSNVGRWLGRDSIDERGGINLYGFLNNSVSSKTDFIGNVDNVSADITVTVSGICTKDRTGPGECDCQMEGRKGTATKTSGTYDAARSAAHSEAAQACQSQNPGDESS